MANPNDNSPLLMGILNVTPDSFSDGGEHDTVSHAVAHGLKMAREGAAIIDVGGESTRPGSQRVTAAEQINRVVEPIRQLRATLDQQGFDQVTISIDTTLVEVAQAALDAGAAMLNDVSAGREDSAMFSLAAERNAPIALMHMLGQPGTMQDKVNPYLRPLLGVSLPRRAIAVLFRCRLQGADRRPPGKPCPG